MKKELITELLSLVLENKNNESPFKVGKKYFIRTVTYHSIGELKSISGKFLMFDEKEISWVAYSGRFMQAIKDGKLDEVEPIHAKGGINMDSIVDFFEWNHDIPTKQL